MSSLPVVRWAGRPRQRCTLISAQLCGAVLCIAVVAWLFNRPISALRPLKPVGEYDAQVPVAVVGAGPSGLSSAWMLAHGGRRVVLFEASDRLGGHSKSHGDIDGKNFDLGFIFDNVKTYDAWHGISEHFNHSLISSSLNTSSFYNGKYWDNTDAQRNVGMHGEELEKEIDRFNEFVKQPPTLLRTLTPFGLWSWWNGFSDEFVNGPMKATLTVLFVTKMGLMKQSAQAVLNHFKESGFTHLRHDHPKVHRGSKSSNFVWQAVVQDMLATGQVEIQYNHKISSVERVDEHWTLGFDNGASKSGFSDVILAIPASVSSKVVRGRPLQSLTVSQVEYFDSQVTLHTDANATIWPNFAPASQDVLYFVGDNHMTGYIAKIFGYGEDSTLLTVHDMGDKGCPIDPKKVLWQTVWSHHSFALWELFVALVFVPLFNGNDGLHYAGDWIEGVGHNDAIKSGIGAVCQVGIPRMPINSSATPLYEKLRKIKCSEA